MQKNIELKSNSGKMISLLIMENSKSPKYCFLDVHGSFEYSKEKTFKDNQELVDYAQLKGCNYMAIDLSNNGTRPDQPVSGLSYTDRIKDVHTALEFIKSEYACQTILVGSSMGGFVSLNAAVDHLDYIYKIILNCAAVKMHEHIKPGIPGNEFENWEKNGTVNVWGVPFSYAWYQEVESLDVNKVLPKITVPILWFHGTDDQTVSIDYVIQAIKNIPNCRLYKIQGGGHRFGSAMQKGEWIGAIIKFLEA